MYPIMPTPHAGNSINRLGKTEVKEPIPNTFNKVTSMSNVADCDGTHIMTNKNRGNAKNNEPSGDGRNKSRGESNKISGDSTLPGDKIREYSGASKCNNKTIKTIRFPKEIKDRIFSNYFLSLTRNSVSPMKDKIVIGILMLNSGCELKRNIEIKSSALSNATWGYLEKNSAENSRLEDMLQVYEGSHQYNKEIIKMKTLTENKKDEIISTYLSGLIECSGNCSNNKIVKGILTFRWGSELKKDIGKLLVSPSSINQSALS